MNLDTLATVIAESAVKGTAVLAAAWTYARLLRGRPATDRHRVWRLALVSLLALPILVALLPSLQLAWLPADATAASGRAAAPEPRSDLSVTIGRQMSRPAQDSCCDTGGLAQGDGAIPSYFAGISLAVSLIFLGYLGIGLWRAHMLCRKGSACLDAERTRHFASLAAELGCTRPVRVLSAPGVSSPIALGWHRPTILLPPTSLHWTGEKIDAALAHELAHVAHKDWLQLLLGRVTVALFWFHPLAWLAFRHQQQEAEQAADECVLSIGVEAPEYAQLLVDVAREARRSDTFAAAAMARPSWRTRTILSRRIHTILEDRIRRPAMRRHHVFVLTAAALAFTLAIAPAHLVHARADVSDHDQVSDNDQVSGHDKVSGHDDESGRDEDSDRDETDYDFRFDNDFDDADDPLLEAAGSGDRPRVELLLAAGADPNRVSPGDGSPLIAASLAGNHSVVELLLDAGADPDLGVSGDGNPLIAASLAGNHGVVDLLLDAGANPDLGVSGDGNPLIAAAIHGDPEAVTRLLDFGADPNRAVPGDGNPLIAAAAAGRNDVVRLLLDRGADLEATVEGDENALIKASEMGQLSTVELLLDAGADPNVAITVERWKGGEEVRTAISQAKRNGHRAVVELLLARGARE